MLNPTDSAAIATVYAATHAPSRNAYSTLFETRVPAIFTIYMIAWAGVLPEQFGSAGAVTDIRLGNLAFHVGIFRDMLVLSPSQIAVLI